MPVPPPTPPERPPELSGEAALALKVSPPDDTACRTRLKRLGVEFEPLPPIAEPASLRRFALDLFDRSFAITYVLEAVAILVGLAGVAAVREDW